MEQAGDAASGNIAEPLSRIIARTALGKQYGRQIIDSNDYIAVLIGLWSYHRDLAGARARKREALKLKRIQAQLGQPQEPTNEQPQPTPQPEAQSSDGTFVPAPLSFVTPPGATID